jgi:hypothetical protein
MSVQRKSLISDAKTEKKAPIASQPTEQTSPLKINSLTAHSMRRKKGLAQRAAKGSVSRFGKK